MKHLSKGEIIVYTILIISLIMVNPPIINLVNDYAIQVPMMLGQPTLFLWLQGWFVLAIAAFLIGAIKIKRWKKEYKDPTNNG